MSQSLIPASILKHIFKHIVSQRYLAQVALVCKAWQDCAEKILYNVIHFYSLKQFIHFLNLTEMRYQKTAYTLVNEVTFHFDIINTKESLTSLKKAIHHHHHQRSSKNNSSKDNNTMVQNVALHQLDYVHFLNQRRNICFADLMAVFNRRCPSIQHINILNKEKHMKHIQYNIDALQREERKNVFAHFLGWSLLKDLPFWHQDQQRELMQRQQNGHYFLKLDIYASLSGIHIINDAGFFTFPAFPQLNQLYIDFFQQDKTYLLDRAIMETLNHACPHLTFLTLVNVDIEIYDTRPHFDYHHYLKTYRPPYSSRTASFYMERDGVTPKIIYGGAGDDCHLHVPMEETLRDYWNDANWHYCHSSITVLSDLLPQHCQPNHFLKQLTLKNVKLLAPSRSILYFHRAYPNITTLELLDMDFTPDHCNTPQVRKENRDEFRTAMGHFFMSFEQLTKFHFTLHPAIPDHCAHALWPRFELMTWLSTHPKQFTSLTWPCDLFFFFFPSSSSSFFSKEIPSQDSVPWTASPQLPNPLYLQHLLELDLTLGPSCSQEKVIQDYLMCSKLPLLETLSISYLERPTSKKERKKKRETATDDPYYGGDDDDDNENHVYNSHRKKKYKLDKTNNHKKIDIFAWLDICPQLKNLKLKGVVLIDTNADDHGVKMNDNDADDDNPVKVDIEKKEKEKEKEKEKTPIYSLNKLTLEQVDIYMKHGLDDICQRCPQLKVLWCDYINCRWQPISMVNYMKEYRTFCETPIFIINALSLNLDTLYLGHVNNVFEEYNYTFTIGKAMVYELGKSSLSYFTIMDNTAHFKHQDDDESTITPFIEVHCRLVDQATLIGKHNTDDRDAFRGFLLQHPENPEHIRLAKLSRKGLAAYQEEKKHFEEWEYLDTNDDDVLITSDDDGDDRDNNQYVNEDMDDYFYNESNDDDDDDDNGEIEEEEDNDDEFLLC